MKISEGMLSKLDKIKQRFDFLASELAKSEVVSNQAEFKKLSKEHSDLEPIVEGYSVLQKHLQETKELEAAIASEKDADMKEFFKDEYDRLLKQCDEDVQNVKILLLPKDPNEDNNVIMEIRAGAGGDEAGLFGTELMKMYKAYAEKNRWKTEDISMNMSELGGVKEAVFMITGKGAYGKLMYESGVHRVQRVPETE